MVEQRGHTERLTTKELAEMRELVKFGAAIGIGGRTLAAVLDEIDHRDRAIREVLEAFDGPGIANTSWIEKRLREALTDETNLTTGDKR